MKHDEYILQRAVVKKLREQGIVVFSIPNERNMGISDSVRMRNAGLTKGAPDLICWDSTTQCWWLELKTPIGKRSIEQMCMEDLAAKLNIKYKVVRTLSDIDELLSLKSQPKMPLAT